MTGGGGGKFKESPMGVVLPDKEASCDYRRYLDPEVKLKRSRKGYANLKLRSETAYISERWLCIKNSFRLTFINVHPKFYPILNDSAFCNAEMYGNDIHIAAQIHFQIPIRFLSYYENGGLMLNDD